MIVALPTKRMTIAGIFRYHNVCSLFRIGAAANGTGNNLIQPYRSLNRKTYDKRILLEPEDIEYRHDDAEDKFLRGQSFADEPYIRPTADEIVELQRIKLDGEISCEIAHKVDPTAAPFNQVLEGFDDGGRFTKVEKIP